MNDIDLAALLASRLCHDLISPIGAVNNGLEVLADESDPAMRDKAIELMAFSAGEAARRLKFYRLAVGSAGGEAEPITLEEAREASRGLLEAGKIALEWPDACTKVDPAPSKPQVKLLLNMLFVGGECLVRGGTLSVRAERKAKRLHLKVAAEGPGARLSEAAGSLLRAEAEAEGLTPRSVIPYLAARIAASLEVAIKASTPAKDRVELGVTL